MFLIKLNRFTQRPLTVEYARCFSYKAIKRPSLSKTLNAEYVDRKMKEFDLPKLLRTKIQASGPITSKTNGDSSFSSHYSLILLQLHHT
jgi:hypothetical protein